MAETTEFESDLAENNFDPLTLLCLAGSDKQDGSPIASTESLRRHLPYRFFGTLKHLEPDSTLFSVSLLNDPRNFSDFQFQLNSYYQSNFSSKEVTEVEDDGLYICRIKQEFHRCRLINVDKNESTDEVLRYHVHLIDVGKSQDIQPADLFYFHYEFNAGVFAYSFALRCCSPEADYLKHLQLPTLDQFRENEVVEVIVCSIHEPCLAVIFSTTKHYSRIRPEIFIDGMDITSAEIWKSNFLESAPSFEGIINGLYPPVVPLIYPCWSLVTVAGFSSLENVYIRDIASSVRLSILQEILNDFYMCEDNSIKMKFPDFFLPPDLPCVVFDEISQKYFRAKIVRFSGDRSVFDVLAVDYPNLSFKAVSKDELYMLSDRFNLPPQAVSIQLVENEDKLQVHFFTKLASHFIDVGSVVAVSLPPKATVASLRCLDDADVLEKIGYYKKLEADKHVSAMANPPINRDFASSIPFGANETQQVNQSFLTPGKFNSQITPIRPVNQTSAVKAPIVHGTKLSSILKKSEFGLSFSKSKIPIGCQEVVITAIVNADAIFYRTQDLAKNYAALTDKIAKEKEKLVRVPQEKLVDKLKPDTRWILLSGSTQTYHRIIILENNSVADDIRIRYQCYDTGVEDDIFETMDIVYILLKSLGDFKRRVVVGPCRLAITNAFGTNEKLNSEPLRTDLRTIGKLRTLFPEDGRCYIQDFIQDKDNSYLRISSPGTNNTQTSSTNNKWVKEIVAFKPDGTSINEQFFEVLKTLEENDKKISWVVPK